MIKNRESAARSRARKQAYTVELEAEVTLLKEENMRLLKIQAELEEKARQQVLEASLRLVGGHAGVDPPVTVRSLRRTQTPPW
eukprot:SM000153S01592  [mRNA]  locus=s153:161613:162688:+ [translate_table: standard]